MAYKVHWLMFTRGGRSHVGCGRYRVTNVSENKAEVTCGYCLRAIKRKEAQSCSSSKQA